MKKFMVKMIFLCAVLCTDAASLSTGTDPVATLKVTRSEHQPLYVFCGTGDHLWNPKVEPVDSPASIDAMFDWMADTYGINRMYWRGGQSGMWSHGFKSGRFHFITYDWSRWKSHLYNGVGINKAAITAARRHGMEIFMYTGLFEAGLQPDLGVVGPYQFEDRLRIEHPEWCPVDRWGTRRQPGMISFCYPEARAAVIDRLVHEMDHYGYDGVNFYTYVENSGIRYEDEFGFEQPIVDAFNLKYPKVDLRKDILSPEQKTFWYRCKGEFVTLFLQELKARLSKSNKKLSLILDAKEPYYPQPWWGCSIRGTGKMFIDYDRLIEDGTVDEFWVQLDAVVHQQKLLDELLIKCRGKKIRLTVRAIAPLNPTWKKYTEQGVTPIAVITWKKNGIERLSLKTVGQETLGDKDWKVRAQTLRDITAGKVVAKASSILPLTTDSAVLVRRNAVLALAATAPADAGAVAAIEDRLIDDESCVRITAATALCIAHRPESASAIVAALEKHSGFQFKNECVRALSKIGEDAYPVLASGIANASSGVREVSVQALYKYAASTTNRLDEIFANVYKIMMDPREDYVVRCHAIETLAGKGWISHAGLVPLLSDAPREQLMGGVLKMIRTEPNVDVQLRAVFSLQFLMETMSDPLRKKSLVALRKLFMEYGDGCLRSDAAYGWRIVGNMLVAFGDEGVTMLDEWIASSTAGEGKATHDKWLAWTAYRVLYEVYDRSRAKHRGFNLVDEADAIRMHNRHAPEFPGWRTWIDTNATGFRQ